MEKKKKLGERWSDNSTTLERASEEERKKATDASYETMLQNIKNLKVRKDDGRGKDKK